MGKSPACAMATCGKGNDGKIAGARGNGNIRQVNGVCGECDDKQTIVLMMDSRDKGDDGQIAMRTMAMHGRGNIRQVAGTGSKGNVGQVCVCHARAPARAGRLTY